MVEYFNKGVIYDSENLKRMFVIAPKELIFNEDCNTLNGMITLNFKDFPLFDTYECFGDFLADLIEQLEEEERSIE